MECVIEVLLLGCVTCNSWSVPTLLSRWFVAAGGRTLLLIRLHLLQVFVSRVRVLTVSLMLDHIITHQISVDATLKHCGWQFENLSS